MVGADAAGGDDHRLGGELELAHRSPAGRGTPRGVVRRPARAAAHAGDRAPVDDQLVHPVPVVEADQPGARPPAWTDRTNGSTTPGAGAPGDVEPRHRVAVPVGAQVAPLGPADGGQEAQAERRSARTRFSPAANSTYARAHRAAHDVLVVQPVELGAALPVAPGQLDRVPDAAAGAARGCRPGTARRTTSTPGRRGWPGPPGRPAQPACRPGSARGWRPGRPGRRRRRRHRRPPCPDRRRVPDGDRRRPGSGGQRPHPPGQPGTRALLSATVRCEHRLGVGRTSAPAGRPLAEGVDALLLRDRVGPGPADPRRRPGGAVGWT